MRRKFFCISAILFTLSILACTNTVKTNGTINIIPKPVYIEPGNGVFKLTANTKIVLLFNSNGMPYATNLINEVVKPFFKKKLQIIEASETSNNNINISYNKLFADEEYALSISAEQIAISASTAKGVFYAFESLRQLIPLSAYNKTIIDTIELPSVNVNDKPTFSYRGMMFDVVRHFYTVEEIKQTIDILALHKMNRFHWHLTDDQGWRIEIKKYPKLTEIGSIRNETLIGHLDYSNTYDGKPYGGFYTQNEIKEVVRYAQERFITVIPEIELPGHAVAALTAYPYLGCKGSGYSVYTKWGVSHDVFCAGKDSTFKFFEDILTEVMELFPSEYIHIGGDECPKTEWEKCPACQARIKKEGLKNEIMLQGYVTNRVEKFLNQHGRKIIGWDEILEGNVTPGATIMSWRGSEGGIEAAKKGNYAIMSPHRFVYLDYFQTYDSIDGQVKTGAYLPLEKVYSFDPYDQLNTQEQKFILGVQANLWTEYITTYSYAQYMMLPRLSALAEVGWSYDRKDYNDFKTRLKSLSGLFDVMGYNYAK